MDEVERFFAWLKIEKGINKIELFEAMEVYYDEWLLIKDSHE